MSNLEHQDSIFHSLLFIFRDKLSGCFEVILPNSQTVEVWIYQGKIVTVVRDDCDLKQLLIKHTTLGEQKTELVFNDFAKQTITSKPKPLGYYLEKIYDINSDIIEHIFEKQIAYFKEVANLDLRYHFCPIKNKTALPFKEMTGLAQEIDNLLLDILNNELNLKEWYLNYPAACFCLELNSSEKFHITQNKLHELDHQILTYADEKTTLKDISKLANISLEKVQKSAFILNSFGFVEYVLSPRERAKFSKNLFYYGELKEDLVFNTVNNQKERILLLPPIIFAATIISLFLGVFQLLECQVLDLFFVQHQEEKDSRITLVTINDHDLEPIGKYPLPDGIIAQALKTIQEHNPRVIGLDMYRNLSIEPGTEELSEIFKTTTNLIGVEKISSPPIKPHQILERAGQISFADIMIDSDGFTRRALLSLEKDNQIKEAFGTSLAFIYLSPEPIDFNLEENNYYIGKAKITPLLKLSGGYWKRNLGGYQMIINYRGGIDRFNQISLTQILTNEFDSSLIEDKIIIVGSISDADKDIVFTPESKTSQGIQGTPGIVIHANHASQLISAALDGRPLLKPRSKIEEIIFILVVTIVVIAFSLSLLHILARFENVVPSWSLYLIISLLTTGGIVIFNYGLFLQGWWLPTIPTVICSSISSMILIDFLYKKSKNRIFFDTETSLPNRYYLKIFLNKIQKNISLEDKHLLVIDIDEFGKYRNTYSKQVVLAALNNISKIMCDTLESGDFVCRYNQNIFMLYFATKNSQEISHIGELLEKKLYELAIPFEDSQEGLLKISSFINPVSDI